MGSPRGFINIKKQSAEYRPVCERVKDYKEAFKLRDDERSKEQSSRCMDCGTPFCHWGCPVGNYIPEWNDLVSSGNWQRAWELLEATNVLPEVTGRVCPAPCEHACVLGINDDPVTIRENELAIIEYAFKQGWVNPQAPRSSSGRRAAVVGSGPAGLACAVWLNRMGHEVVLFERDDKLGGIMRYGIPDFKLDKNILDRRIAVWKKEGIDFRTGINAGKDISARQLLDEFGAVCLAGGSRVPRDLPIEGRQMDGIHFAMEYLTQSNRKVAGEKMPLDKMIDAKGKKVVVIGGGDTGADCVGTANRQGAACVIQIEVLSKPPECRTCDYPWPKYPLLLKTTSSHEEGADRRWEVITKRFVGENGQVKKLICERAGIPDSVFEIDADLVILAVGFLRPEPAGLLADLGVKFDDRGNVLTDKNHMTSVNKVFSAGDMRRGQSLIVWAIAEGIVAAGSIDRYLREDKWKPF